MLGARWASDLAHAFPTYRLPPTTYLLGLILAAYLALAGGYALATPRWNNPDEPAHYNYVRELASTGRLPVIRPGDWDADLLERLKAARFPDDGAIAGIRYEGHQPPLYYLLATPVYRLTSGLGLDGQVLALKGLSILFGAVVVVGAYWAGREAFPPRPAVALLAAATVAFIPMHTAISAAINNDSLANALAALTCVALLAGLRRGFDDKAAVILGALLGAILLTKLTAYLWVPLSLAAVALSERRRAAGGHPSWRGMLRRPALALGAAGAVSAWWFYRNMLVYGRADPLGAIRHDQVVNGQPQWQRLDVEAGDYLVRVLFRSFWGQFGWMGIVLEDRLYLLYLALTLAGLLGLALGAVKYLCTGSGSTAEAGDDGPAVEAWHRPAVGSLAAATLLAVAQVALYNLRFIQPQGRYLFPTLVPIALLLALGWLQLAQVAGARRRLEALPAGALAAVAVWSLLDAVGPLFGRFWPGRLVVLAGGLSGLALALAPPAWRRAAQPGLVVAFATCLGLLDLACLIRVVGPAFQ